MYVKTLISAAILAASLMTAGAAAQTRDARYVIESVARIQPGKSNAKDVESVLGKPDRVTRNSRKNQDEWGYAVYTDMKRGTLWVVMSDDGVVREVIQVMDRRMGTT